MRTYGIKPYLAGVGFATIFGFSFLFTKVALDHIDPFRLIGFRFSIAAIVVSLLVLLKVIKVSFKGKDIRPLLWVASLQPIAYFIFETTGISLTSSSQAGMMIALIPIVVAVLSSVMLKERVRTIQWVFIILSVSGVACIALQGAQGVGGSITGYLLLLGAVLSAALFNIASRRSSESFTPYEITFVMMWTGAVTFTLLGLLSHARAGSLGSYLEVLYLPEVWGALLYLSILSSVIAFGLVNYSLSKIPASQSAVFANLTTVVSIVAGVVFRGEAFHWVNVLGAVMILAGVWGTNYFGAVFENSAVEAA